MKISKLIIGCIVALALTSCNDYLDVDAPSKYTTDFVYSSTTEASRALNGVYACLLNDNTYGKAFTNNLILNSDVDYASSSTEVATPNSPKRFDMDASSSTANSVWNATYNGIETANTFIYYLESSELLETAILTKDTTTLKDINQMLGEAKVIRAMFYNELCDYWGDVPFTFLPTYIHQDFITPIVDRTEIRETVIKDLINIAPSMKSVTDLTDGVERISKEACWAMISRLALSAGGYSLRPDKSNPASYGKMERPENWKEFYTTAREYAKKVMDSGTHSLKNSFQEVFVNECNYVVVNDDDPIFEIPFAKESNGYIGYSQGPTLQDNAGVTDHNWGKADGNIYTESFYRYSFDESDLRRDYLDGLWYYTYQACPTIRSSYGVHNNKWSKLWHKTGLGPQTSDKTGINYPYLRYADVLLMFAEADNELNGPTTEAQAALAEVRERAFDAIDWWDKVDNYISEASANKETFKKAILDERKWEFAGENMRWKDLVRNNLYSETLYWTFLRYWGVAENSFSTSYILDLVEQHEGRPSFYSNEIPATMWYCYIQNPGKDWYYTNTQLPVLYIANPFKTERKPAVSPQTYFDDEGIPYKAIAQPGGSSSTIAWVEGTFYGWWEDAGYPKPQILYSLYGFMRGTDRGNINLVRDGKEELFTPSSKETPTNLPVVRYILPIPREAITRSENQYKNYYGY